MKTVPNQKSVDSFLSDIENEEKRADCMVLLGIMKEITGAEPRMWGDSIVGFGNYHYVYESGREGDWFFTGFSPRKQNLTIYIMNGFKRYEEYLGRLGKHKNSVSCLYVKRLTDVNLDVLKEMIGDSVEYLKEKYCS